MESSENVIDSASDDDSLTDEKIAKANQAMFDTFAKTYDESVLSSQRYKAHGIISNLLVKYVGNNLEAQIFDAGSGTGLVGVELAKFGFKHLIAGDISRNMLEECKKKQLYEDYVEIVLGNYLNFGDKTFDAVVCCGVFQPYGPPASSFDELVRVCKSGAYILFTWVTYVAYRSRARGYQEEVEFPNYLASLETNGKWKLVEETDEMYYTPGQDPDTMYRIYVYKVL